MHYGYGWLLHISPFYPLICTCLGAVLITIWCTSMAIRPSNLSLHLSNSSLLHLPEQPNKPIKAVYPLVNLRFFSHHKYHAVKEQIRQEDKKLARSMSLSKAKSGVKVTEVSRDEGKNALFMRARTLGSQSKLSIPPLKLETRNPLPITKKRKNAGFWHKKLQNMKKSLLDFDRLHGRASSMS